MPVRPPLARAAAALAAAVLACVLVSAAAVPHEEGLGLGSLRIAGSHHVMPAVKAQVAAAVVRPNPGPQLWLVPAVVPPAALVFLLLARRRRGRPFIRPPLIMRAAHCLGVRGPPVYS